MGSNVISFRFSDQEIELLRQRAIAADESTNAIAQRLLREMLGVYTPASTSVNNLEERVRAIVDSQVEVIASQVVDKCLQQRIQDEIVPLLGELSA